MSFVVIDPSRFAVGAPASTGLFGDIVGDLNYLDNVIVSSNDAGGAPLIVNGSFESPSVATSTAPNAWTIVAGNAGAAVSTATDQNHGAQSLKFTRDTTAGHSGGTATSTDFFAVSPGLSYLFSFMIKSSRTDVSNTVVVNWYDATQGALSSTTLLSQTAGTTSWVVQKANGIIPPATAMFGKIVISGGTSTTTPASTATIYFDGFSCKARDPLISSQTFTSTSTFTVPSGVFAVRVKMSGGRYTLGNGTPGLGAYVEGDLSVLPGDSITITFPALTSSATTVVYGGTTFSCGNGVTPSVNGTAIGGYLNLNGTTSFNQSNTRFVVFHY